MRYSFEVVRLLSSIAVAVLFYVSFFLLTLEPLAQNIYARYLAVEARMLDPKIQRSHANGTLDVSHDQFATDVLNMVDHYTFIPIGIVFISIIATLVGLWSAKYNQRVFVTVLLFDSFLSLFIILPHILLTFT